MRCISPISQSLATKEAGNSSIRGQVPRRAPSSRSVTYGKVNRTARSSGKNVRPSSRSRPRPGLPIRSMTPAIVYAAKISHSAGPPRRETRSNRSKNTGAIHAASGMTTRYAVKGSSTNPMSSHSHLRSTVFACGGTEIGVALAPSPGEASLGSLIALSPSDEAPAEQVLIAATPSMLSQGTPSAWRRPLDIGPVPGKATPLIQGAAAKCPAARGGRPVISGPRDRVAMIRTISGMISAAVAWQRAGKASSAAQIRTTTTAASGVVNAHPWEPLRI